MEAGLKEAQLAEIAKIKNRLNAFCKDCGVAQSKLAGELGMSQQGVARWFSSKTEEALPTLFAVQWLIKNHNLNFDWLMTGEGAPKNESCDNTTNINVATSVSQPEKAGGDCGRCLHLIETNKMLVEQNIKLQNKLS